MEGPFARVLDHQKATLSVAAGTLLLTVILYVGIYTRDSPIQDAGACRASPRRRKPCPSGHGQASHVAKVILKDPAVESLSSFIGVDGTNTTLNDQGAS